MTGSACSRSNRRTRVALLALGVACWLARDVAVVAVLVLAWTSPGPVGIGFWPAALAHVGLAAWCIAGLSTPTFEEKRSWTKACPNYLEETKMKLSIALSALLITGFVAASTEEAGAVVYCQYVAYPAGCVVRPGVVLRPRPVARAVVTPGVGAVGVGVRRGTPMNRGGPVNRVGRR